MIMCKFSKEAQEHCQTQQHRSEK